MIYKSLFPACTLLLAAVSIPEPGLHAAGSTPPMSICTDYHCEARREVQLSPQEWQSIFEVFRSPAGNARDERVQISRSVALLEALVGKHAGTDKDMAENEGEDMPGQLDCISESTNTTQYLNRLDELGLLKWHHILPVIERNPHGFSRHLSARIQEIHDNRQYVVDSWFYKNAEPPVIQPVEDWLRHERPANHVIP